MNPREIFTLLQAPNVRGLLAGLLLISENLHSPTLKVSFADRLYHTLVPLLTHTHYKVRALSFSIAFQLLDLYKGEISSPDIALASVLVSMNSVNKTVANTSVKFLKIILDISPVESFWIEICAVIAGNRSDDVRLKVLNLLVEIAKRIPLAPVLKLLDDPKAHIRAAARQIIDAADPEAVKAALLVTKLSYETTQALLIAFPLSLSALRSSSEAEDSPGSKFRSRAARLRQAADQHRQSRSRSHFPMHTGSPVSYSSLSLRRQQMQHATSLQQVSSNSLRHDALGDDAQAPKERGKDMTLSNLQSREHPRVAIFANAYSPDHEPDDASPARRTAAARRRRGREAPANEEEEGDSNELVSDHSDDREAGGEVPRSSDRRLKHYQSKSQASELRVRRAPLGRIIHLPKVSLSVRPRDLSTATWLERVSFLEKLKESLADIARFREPPSQIVECVLTTAVPVHKRVVCLIPPILSELILHHPEVLRVHLVAILTFTLNEMPLEEREQNDPSPDFDQFLSVLCLEADPNDAIEWALRICDKSARRLPLQKFIVKIYDVRHDTALAYNVLAHLTTWLLKNPGSEQLLEILCTEEFKGLQRFGATQPAEVRKALLPHMKRAQAQRASDTASVSSAASIDVGTDRRTLKGIIEEEFSKGSSADVPRCVASLLAFPDQKPDLFLKFLFWLGHLPMRAVVRYEKELAQLCCQKFGAPTLLHFLKDDWQDPKVISGLSRCIWHCPGEILEGSELYLKPLYTLFRRSIGPKRIDLAQIFLAIWRKTGHSVLDLEEVCDPHRNLLNDLMAQYQVVQ
jgi:hypothetical protein